MSELIKGLMVLVSIAIATGHYNELARFARREAAKALFGKSVTRPFFSNSDRINGVPKKHLYFRPGD